VYRFEDIIGESEEIKKVKKLARRAARTSSAILINGESGTGKELLAQAIHNESFRKDKPFIAINCGAIPSELIESELFGYEPGAFTGASKGIKLGKLEVASGGTFFFDEVESMPLNVQVKLLRALSANKITRIGGVEEIPIDIRIIAATKKDLLLEAEKGNFREDLYFRINIISLNLPPLRERKDDVPILAKSFIKYYEKQANLQEIKVEPEFLEALTYYYWRGNVRELRNVMEKATLLNDDMKLTINNLPPKIVDAYKYKSLKEKVDTKINDIKMNKNILQTSEEMIIELVLNEEKWNLTKAAKRLGISRPTLYKKIEEHPRLKKRKDTLQLFRDVK
jgi:transcriptional regulator with PAS, ATPase and Fis domain